MAKLGGMCLTTSMRQTSGSAWPSSTHTWARLLQAAVQGRRPYPGQLSDTSLVKLCMVSLLRIRLAAPYWVAKCWPTGLRGRDMAMKQGVVRTPALLLQAYGDKGTLKPSPIHSARQAALPPYRRVLQPAVHLSQHMSKRLRHPATGIMLYLFMLCRWSRV